MCASGTQRGVTLPRENVLMLCPPAYDGVPPRMADLQAPRRDTYIDDERRMDSTAETWLHELFHWNVDREWRP